MKHLSGRTGRRLLPLATLALLAAAAEAQNPFPEGEGRETVFLVCSQCHSLSRITRVELDAEDWEFYLYDMISRGAPVEKDDIPALKRYLVDNFAADE